MAIGATHAECIEGDWDTFEDYERAYECKRIMENRALHMQGLYNHAALSAVMAHSFPPKGKKPFDYPDYPYPVTETERKAEKERSIMRTLQFVRRRKRGANDG